MTATSADVTSSDQPRSQALRLSLSKGEPLEPCAKSIAKAPTAALSVALATTAKKFPNKGITYLNTDGSVTIGTYRSLYHTALTILYNLRRQGLQPQDKVILQLEHNRDFIEGFWACILGGFVPVPLAVASANKPDSNAAKAFYHSWQRFQQPLILTTRPLVSDLSALATHQQLFGYCVAAIEDLRQGEPDRNTHYHQPDPDDLALLFLNARFGPVPEGVQLSHRNIISNMAAHVQRGWIRDTDVYLNWLPLHNPGPLLRSVIWTTCLGAQQVQGEISTALGNPLKWLDWIEQYRATITWSPNFALGLLNDRADEIKAGRWDLTSIRYWLNTAEPIVPKTGRTFLNLMAPHGLRADVLHGVWGMKETAASATDSNQYAAAAQIAKDPLLADLGLPLPGFALRIVNDQNELVVEQTIGHLQVKGDCVTCGYYQSPELNQAVFTADGWYKTGDLGFLSAGRLTLTGRSKALIIINGKNHYSHEIEQAIAKIEGLAIDAVAAIGVRQPSSHTDSVIVFFEAEGAKRAKGAKRAQPVEQIQAIRQQVVLKVGISPAQVIPLAPALMPRMAQGMIDRRQLQQQYETGEFEALCEEIAAQLSLVRQRSQAANYQAPTTKIEKQLASIWKSLLNVERVGRHDNFFELGGDSLLGMQLYAALEEQFSRKIPVNTLFDAPTLAGLSNFLEQPDSQPWDSLVLLKPGKDKTPLFLIHDADGEIVLYLNLARQLHPDRPVYGLRPYGKEGFPILHTRRDELVNHYIARIRSVQPDGPYLLSGLCDGGVIAYEVGQQIQQEGGQIGIIALLDAIDKEAPRIPGTEDVKTVQQRGRLLLFRFLIDREIPLPAWLRNRVTVRKVLRLIKAGYVPKSFEGKLLLFKATEGSGSVNPAFKKTYEPLFGWDKRAAEVEVYIIPGNHSSILQAPSVSLLAEKIEACIYDAIG